MVEPTVYNPTFGEPSGSPFTNKALCLLAHSGQQINLPACLGRRASALYPSAG